MNPLIMTLTGVTFSILIAVITLYIHTSNSVTKSQDETIRKLIAENKALKEEMSIAKRTVEIHDNRVDSANIPDYDQKW